MEGFIPAIAASITVAPFENLSGDPTQDMLALGFVEDVASALGDVHPAAAREVARDGAARDGHRALRLLTRFH